MAWDVIDLEIMSPGTKSFCFSGSIRNQEWLRRIFCVSGPSLRNYWTPRYVTSMNSDHLNAISTLTFLILARQPLDALNSKVTIAAAHNQIESRNPGIRFETIHLDTRMSHHILDRNSEAFLMVLERTQSFTFPF